MYEVLLYAFNLFSSSFQESSSETLGIQKIQSWLTGIEQELMSWALYFQYIISFPQQS